jgi:hypothetical protein
MARPVHKGSAMTNRQLGLKSSLLSLAGAFALVAFGSGTASAHQGAGGPVGLGVGFGTPTGFSLEIDATRNTPHDSSFELALGFDVLENAGTYVHAVYKLNLFQIAHGNTVNVPLYVGIGGYLFDYNNQIDDGINVGLRAPLGINFDFVRAPVQVFVEVALGLELLHRGDNVPYRDLWVGGYGGIRYFF